MTHITTRGVLRNGGDQVLTAGAMALGTVALPSMIQHFFFPRGVPSQEDPSAPGGIPNLYAGSDFGYVSDMSHTTSHAMTSSSSDDRIAVSQRDAAVLAPDLRTKSMTQLLNILKAAQTMAAYAPSDFMALCKAANSYGRLAALLMGRVIAIYSSDVDRLDSLLRTMSHHLMSITEILADHHHVTGAMHLRDLHRYLQDFALEVRTTIDEMRSQT